MSTYTVNNECELVTNVQMKQQTDKKVNKNDIDKLIRDYDQFMTTLTTLKVTKTVN